MSPLQNSEPAEHVGQLFSLLQRCARLVLTRNLLQRAAHDFRFNVAWNDDHAVDIAEDEVTSAHAHTGAHHRHVTLDHSRTALGVEWPNAATEHRKSHLTD